MSANLSKICADFLRTEYNAPNSGERLKASHARELVAAFFGYKSHAALIADHDYPLEALEEARLLVPDIPLLEKRSERLSGLPVNLPSSWDISKALSAFLQSEGYFGGETWIYDTLENYIMEELLINEGSIVDDELSGVMAGTNAFFDEAYYESAVTNDQGSELIVMVEGTYYGSNHPDKPFSGNEIDMQVIVTLYRVAGRRGFSFYEISAGGNVRDDWRDPEPESSGPQNLRPKEQFIEMTGGFRFGETPEQFQRRQKAIEAIRAKISAGGATMNDIDTLSSLLGREEEEF
ncbi:MAG: hypothetical protein AB2806_00875 [Candidatus Thiodiazotropha sp.]